MNKPSIELIALIYKSPNYLYFVAEQMKSNLCKVPGWDVSLKIIGNDPTPEILSILPDIGIPYDIYNNPDPNEYYINRVYKCHNYGGFNSKSENICFLNSDVLLSSGWLEALLKHHDGINIPCSRLVESGKMPSGLYAISKYFGNNPKTIKYNEWKEYANEIKEDITKPHGLFGPCVFNREMFIKTGGYPPGNIYVDGIGAHESQFLCSGDQHYFHRVLEPDYGMRHITVFDSIVYHIQEGEKDD